MSSVSTRKSSKYISPKYLSENTLKMFIILEAVLEFHSQIVMMIVADVVDAVCCRCAA